MAQTAVGVRLWRGLGDRDLTSVFGHLTRDECQFSSRQSRCVQLLSWSEWRHRLYDRCQGAILVVTRSCPRPVRLGFEVIFVTEMARRPMLDASPPSLPQEPRPCATFDG